MPELINTPAPTVPVAPDKHYRVVGLKVSNVKKIKAIDISPTTDVVTVGGKNGAGKSSLLDSLAYAIGGAAMVCERPIREGQSEAHIAVDLGDFIITKSFSANSGAKLKIALRDGTAVSSPQTILDKLCSKLAFDPMEFTRMEGPKMADTLRKLVNLDFTALDSKRKEVYDKRTDTNRTLAQKKAQLAGKTVHEGVPAEEVSVKALMADLSILRAHNRNNDLVKQTAEQTKLAHSSIAHDIEIVAVEIEALKKQILDKEAEKGKMLEELNKIAANVASTQDAVDRLAYRDETPITTQIEEADTINAKVRQNQERSRLVTEIEQLEVVERDHTKHLERIDREKATALENAKFPTPGLTFSDTGVMLDGQPFSQANTARQIEASMNIAIAMNPKLRIVFVRNGSLVGKEGHEQIAAIAKAKDIQVWTELLTEDPESDAKCSVVIVDGNSAPKEA